MTASYLEFYKFQVSSTSEYISISIFPPGWTNLFSHNTTGGLFYGSMNNALWKNLDSPSSLLFSVLFHLEDLGRPDGSFLLRICYPELQVGEALPCNEWSQTSNPATDPSSATSERSGCSSQRTLIERDGAVLGSVRPAAPTLSWTTRLIGHAGGLQWQLHHTTREETQRQPFLDLMARASKRLRCMHLVNNISGPFSNENMLRIS